MILKGYDIYITLSFMLDEIQERRKERRQFISYNNFINM